MNIPLFGPLDPNSPAYVHRHFEDVVLQAVQRREYVSLKGGRQTGKTSLILRLRQVLHSQGASSAYVDLSPIGETTTDEPTWCTLLAGAIRSSLQPSALRQYAPDAPARISEFQSYLLDTLRIAAPHRPVVLFFDEITAVPESFRQPFFSTIRALFNQRSDVGAPADAKNLVLVFAGTFDPERLIDSDNSPFNVASTFDTASYDFSPEQVATLGQCLGITTAADVVYELASGHPYLTNRLFSLVAEGIPTDQLQAHLFASGDSNLTHLRKRLPAPGDAAFTLIRDIRAGDSLPWAPGVLDPLDYLILIGLVKADENGNAIIRCRVYEQYLDYLNSIRSRGDTQPSTSASPLGFMPSSALRGHVESLMHLAPELAPKNPALAAACVGAVLEAVLLVELGSRSDLALIVAKLNGEVNQGQLEKRLRIKTQKPHFEKLTLEQMIEMARICGLITKPSSQVTHGLRGWRNLIHPAKFLTEFPNGVGRDIADAAVANSIVLVNELRSHYGLPPISR